MANPSIDDFLNEAEAAHGGASDEGEVAGTVAPAQEMTQPDSAVEDPEGDLPEGDKFDRAYVERVRGEAAKYRTELKKYKEAFEGYGEEDQAALMALAQQLRSDPRSAAQQMAAAAEQILAQYQEEEAAKEATESEYLTKADFERLRMEEEVRNEQRLIETEARELGYTVDLNDVDYRLLLLTAQGLPSGDLREAHAKIQSRYEAKIADFVASKAKEAESSVLPPATGGAPTASTPMEPTFENARARLEEFIRNQK